MPAIVVVASVKSGDGPALALRIYVSLANDPVRRQRIDNLKRPDSDCFAQAFAGCFDNADFEHPGFTPIRVSYPAMRIKSDQQADNDSESDTSDTVIHC